MDTTNIKLEKVLKEDRQRILTILPNIPQREVYSTIGVYCDGSKKYNAVAPKDLESHIEYNLIMRPGRAFFLEGICLNSGYFGEERIRELEKQFAENPQRPQKVKTPYH